MLPILCIGSDASDEEDNSSDRAARPLVVDTATPAESRGAAVCPVILHGDPLTDRKSTFQAHGAEVKTTEEVSELFLDQPL